MIAVVALLAIGGGGALLLGGGESQSSTAAVAVAPAQAVAPGTAPAGRLEPEERELLRARMEARHGSTVAAEPSADPAGGEVVPLEHAS